MEKDKTLKRSNIIVDIILLASISFIIIFLFLNGSGSVKARTFVEDIGNFSYLNFFMYFLILLLAIFLNVLFRLKMSGNLSRFFSSGIDEKRQYFFNTLKECGFKKGVILKSFPFYLTAILILLIGVDFLGILTEY
jgi:hypothetical protein